MELIEILNAICKFFNGECGFDWASAYLEEKQLESFKKFVSECDRKIDFTVEDDECVVLPKESSDELHKFARDYEIEASSVRLFQNTTWYELPDSTKKRWFNKANEVFLPIYKNKHIRIEDLNNVIITKPKNRKITIYDIFNASRALMISRDRNIDDFSIHKGDIVFEPSYEVPSELEDYSNPNYVKKLLLSGRTIRPEEELVLDVDIDNFST